MWSLCNRRKKYLAISHESVKVNNITKPNGEVLYGYQSGSFFYNPNLIIEALVARVKKTC